MREPAAVAQQRDPRGATKKKPGGPESPPGNRTRMGQKLSRAPNRMTRGLCISMIEL